MNTDELHFRIWIRCVANNYSFDKYRLLTDWMYRENGVWQTTDPNPERLISAELFKEVSKWMTSKTYSTQIFSLYHYLILLSREMSLETQNQMAELLSQNQDMKAQLTTGFVNSVIAQFLLYMRAQENTNFTNLVPIEKQILQDSKLLSPSATLLEKLSSLRSKVNQKQK